MKGTKDMKDRSRLVLVVRRGVGSSRMARPPFGPAVIEVPVLTVSVRRSAIMHAIHDPDAVLAGAQRRQTS